MVNNSVIRNNEWVFKALELILVNKKAFALYENTQNSSS